MKRTILLLVALAYVGAAGWIGAVGFATESTATILGDALVTLPSSVVTVPAYYAASGLLAQATGGNPSQS